MSEEIKARLDTLRTRMKAVNAGFRAGGLSQQEVAIGQENVDVLTDALAAIATLTAELTAARAEVERLRGVVMAILAARDAFDLSDRNQASAYYTLVDRPDAAWKALRAALTPAEGVEKNPIIAGLEDAVAGRIGRVTVKPSDELVKAMVGRFLAWRLPKNFHPDGGIIFMPGPHARGDFGEAYINANWPDGANLLDYEQATEMVRHIIAPAEGNWAAYEASIEEGERG